MTPRVRDCNRDRERQRERETRDGKQRRRAKDRLILNLKDRDAESQRQGQRNRDRQKDGKILQSMKYLFFGWCSKLGKGNPTRIKTILTFYLIICYTYCGQLYIMTVINVMAPINI